MRWFCTLVMLTWVATLPGQLSNLDDEFYQPCSINDWIDLQVTEGWNIQPLEQVDVHLSAAGFLTMMPFTVTWYQNYKGALLYKTIEGDFVSTIRVIASNRDETGMPSSASQYSLAGIMLRTPKDLTNGPDGWQPGQENYIFLSAGFASENHPTCPGCPGPHFEVKNTTNSNSNLEVSSIDTFDVVIRLARIHPVVLVLYQLPGDTFVVHRRYTRSDMPDSMQIGFVTYTDYPKANTYTVEFQNSHVLNEDLDPDPSNNPGLPFTPDLIGKYDFIRFDSAAVPPWLASLNLADEGEVPDTAILNFLGYPSQPRISVTTKTWNGTSDTLWNNPSNWTDSSLPGATDSVLITNCSCPLAFRPQLNQDTVTIRKLTIDPGADFLVPTDHTLIIDGINTGTQPLVSNMGTMRVEGTLILRNGTGRGLENTGLLDIGPTGTVLSEIQQDAIYNTGPGEVRNAGEMFISR